MRRFKIKTFLLKESNVDTYRQTVFSPKPPSIPESIHVMMLVVEMGQGPGCVLGLLAKPGVQRRLELGSL